ncbi:MAG: M23 family metallopeptidase [Myxococcales bacterium]|jgi:murein DD-endopeptidase MepM/ murein hydrolase activator NlpD|nr:M23 family metallopeptidase [Myxococcales bacterium]
MTPLLWPTHGFTRVSSPYGERIIDGRKQFHGGIDIACPNGTPVVAPFSGKILRIWDDRRWGGGLSMSLRRSDGLYIGLAHLSGIASPERRLVGWAVGQLINKGDAIAYSGGIPGAPGAGSSKGPHLHLTMRGPLKDRLDALGRDIEWHDRDGRVVIPEVRRG